MQASVARGRGGPGRVRETATRAAALATHAAHVPRRRPMHRGPGLLLHDHLADRVAVHVAELFK